MLLFQLWQYILLSLSYSVSEIDKFLHAYGKFFLIYQFSFFIQKQANMMKIPKRAICFFFIPNNPTKHTIYRKYTRKVKNKRQFFIAYLSR
jgi:hypothetical protein